MPLDVPYGPKRIPKNGQIAIPKELLAEVGLREGDEVHLMVRAGTILIVKSAEVARRMGGIYTDLALSEGTAETTPAVESPGVEADDSPDAEG
jgi:AbrB family looped-hinge helix DNA binding protein